MPLEEEEKIDISTEYSELKKLEDERREIDKKIDTFILGILKALGE